MTCIINFYKIVNTKKYQAYWSPNKKLKYKKCQDLVQIYNELSFQFIQSQIQFLGFQITRPNLNKPLMKKTNKMYKYDLALSFNLPLSDHKLMFSLHKVY